MNEEEWDNFVETHSESSFFHQTGWKKVIEHVYGFKPHYMAARDTKGEIQGILPIFEIRQTTGSKLVSLPFSTAGGILYNNEKAKNSLIKQAKKIVKNKNLDYLELRQEQDIGTDLKTKDYYFHLKLKLNQDSEVIWKNFDKKLRNAIRKAEKSGIIIDKGLNYFEEFYKIFSINMKDLGTPVDKKEFFQEIIKQFPNQIEIYVAKLKNKVVGALFLIKHKKTIKSEWASSLRKYFGYNSAQLTYWQAIQDACKQGFEIFDFGRSVEGEGTYLFKKKFGAKPIRLHYKYFVNKGQMPDTKKTGWKRKLFSKCWSMLPLSIANSIGPKIRVLFP